MCQLTWWWELFHNIYIPCILYANHHIVYFKYVAILLVNYFLIKLGVGGMILQLWVWLAPNISTKLLFGIHAHFHFAIFFFLPVMPGLRWTLEKQHLVSRYLLITYCVLDPILNHGETTWTKWSIFPDETFIIVGQDTWQNKYIVYYQVLISDIKNSKSGRRDRVIEEEYFRLCGAFEQKSEWNKGVSHMKL